MDKYHPWNRAQHQLDITLTKIMKKDTDKEQWGNIELPGLTDDKLLNTNWNHVTSMRKRNADPAFKEYWLSSIQDRTNSIEWQKAQREAMNKRNANPVWRENVANGYKQYVNDPEWQEAQRRRGEQRRNDPEWKRKHAEAMANKSPETRARLSQLAKERMADPQTKQRMAEIVSKAKSKPCITPFGVFASCTEAGHAYNKMRNVTNGKNAVHKRIKNQTQGYRYISKEEYANLIKQDKQDK